MGHPSTSRWLRELKKRLAKWDVEMIPFDDHNVALRMDTADFFEIAIRYGILTARIYFHESVIKDCPNVDAVAEMIVTGRYSSGQVLMDWAWTEIPKHVGQDGREIEQG